MGRTLKFLLIVLLVVVPNSHGAVNPFIKIRFTNIVCETLDKEFIEYDTCAVKAVSRKINYITGSYHLKRIPIYNYSVHISFRYRANGWKPYLNQLTVDICKFTQRRNHPIAKLFYNMIKQYINNFVCPITEAYHYFPNLTNDHFANAIMLPVPQGEYGIFTIWYTNNVPHAKVNIFSTVTEL